MLRGCSDTTVSWTPVTILLQIHQTSIEIVVDSNAMHISVNWQGGRNPIVMLSIGVDSNQVR
jgi:hypothetical protein